MLMIAIFAGGAAVWACARIAEPKARTGRERIVFFKIDSLNLFRYYHAGHPQNVRPMVNRKVFRFSKNGDKRPNWATELRKVAWLGNDERSATLGGCRNSCTIIGL